MDTPPLPCVTIGSGRELQESEEGLDRPPLKLDF